MNNHLVRFDVYNQDLMIVNRFEKPFEMTLTQFEQMISESKILTELPLGAQVHILGLGKFKIQEEKYSVEISEKLLEIKDTIRMLNGEPSTLQLCREVYQQYVDSPTETLKRETKRSF